MKKNQLLILSGAFFLFACGESKKTDNDEVSTTEPKTEEVSTQEETTSTEQNEDETSTESSDDNTTEEESIQLTEIITGEFWSYLPEGFKLDDTRNFPSTTGIEEQIVKMYKTRSLPHLLVSAGKTAFTKVNKTTAEHMELVKKRPQPGTKRISLNLKEINNNQWVVNEYNQSQDSKPYHVFSYTAYKGNTMYGLTIVCDADKYAIAKEEIDKIEASLKL